MLPAIGGFDFSPMVLLFALQMLKGLFSPDRDVTLTAMWLCATIGVPSSACGTMSNRAGPAKSIAGPWA
jgi:hypothetical protein